MPIQPKEKIEPITPESPVESPVESTPSVDTPVEPPPPVEPTFWVDSDGEPLDGIDIFWSVCIVWPIKLALLACSALAIGFGIWVAFYRKK